MGRRAKGSLFRRTRNGKPEAVWSISYRVSGKRVTERAFTDKVASEQLLADRLRQAAREEVGLVDPFRKHRAKPLTTHLADFLAGINARHRTEKHRKLVEARLKAAFDGMGAVHLTDLDLSAAERFLGSVVDGGKSVKTRDHYAMALRQFGEWLVDSERAPRNYFHRLRGVARQSDIKVERMALTPSDVWKLVEAAEVRPVACYRKTHPQVGAETVERLARRGRRRGLLYLFSALTGLRRAECAGIRWIDLDLTEGAASVAPRAATTKAKRAEVLPLDDRLAKQLAELRTELARERGRVIAGTALVFDVPKNLVEQLHKDAEYAKLPLIDEHGRKLDFHALRATFATIMARAEVPMQIARRLMRHSTPAMTIKHYEKLDHGDLRGGSDLVSDAFWRGVVAAQVAANEKQSGAVECAPVRSGDEPRRGVTG